MKWAVGVAQIIALAMIGYGTTDDAAAAPGDRWSTSRNNVNVRAGPGTDFDVLMTVNPGEAMVEVILEGEWYLMSLPDRGRQGWVYAPLIERAPPASAARLAPPSSQPGFAPAPPSAPLRTPTPSPVASQGRNVVANLGGGDPRNGEQVFLKCGGCHTTVRGSHGDGPSLVDVFGNRPAQAPGFAYSDAMRAFAAGGAIWDEATLDSFIRRPGRTVKGTTMPFSGIRDDRDRRDLIAFLRQISAGY